MSDNFQFEPSLFKYLRDLKKHNERPWFKANKARYEDELRSPMLHFIEDFAPHLGKGSENFLADARPIGGSLFRIHRDTRFAKDKTPYKTWFGAALKQGSPVRKQAVPTPTLPPATVTVRPRATPTGEQSRREGCDRAVDPEPGDLFGAQHPRKPSGGGTAP